MESGNGNWAFSIHPPFVSVTLTVLQQVYCLYYQKLMQSTNSSSCKGLWTLAGLFELNLLSFREEVEEEQVLTTRIKLKISHYDEPEGCRQKEVKWNTSCCQVWWSNYINPEPKRWLSCVTVIKMRQILIHKHKRQILNTIFSARYADFDSQMVRDQDNVSARQAHALRWSSAGWHAKEWQSKPICDWWSSSRKRDWKNPIKTKQKLKQEIVNWVSNCVIKLNTG